MNRDHTIAALMCFLVGFGHACAPRVIAADDFDRQCETSENCAPIYEGDVCAPCILDNSAINAADLDAYDSAWDDLLAGCFMNRRAMCDGATGDAVCTDGICTFQSR